VSSRHGEAIVPHVHLPLLAALHLARPTHNEATIPVMLLRPETKRVSIAPSVRLVNAASSIEIDTSEAEDESQ
jgi:hypothetical protein